MFDPQEKYNYLWINDEKGVRHATMKEIYERNITEEYGPY